MSSNVLPEGSSLRILLVKEGPRVDRVLNFMLHNGFKEIAI